MEFLAVGRCGHLMERKGGKGDWGGSSREMWILLRRRRDRQGIKSVAEGEGTEGRRWHGLARFGGVLVSGEVDQR